jgi:DNA-binding NtrC family response regulator
MVHDLGSRSRRPYVAVNCGAIADNLIESELFGHEKGSFTGADRLRKGVLEQADGGTLFLDEVPEMPIELQVKLLRVLETSSFRRVGGENPIDVNVRVVAATNRDPQEAVARGRLREDLLYRLNVFPVHVPPLRDRGDDIVLLARHFLEAQNVATDTSKKLTEAAFAKLRAHTWPGNVRELRNVIERSHILAGAKIEPSHLPLNVDAPYSDSGSALRVHVGTPLKQAERELILSTLKHVDGNRKAAAEILGISLKTLYNRLKRYATRVRSPSER